MKSTGRWLVVYAKAIEAFALSRPAKMSSCTESEGGRLLQLNFNFKCNLNNTRDRDRRDENS